MADANISVNKQTVLQFLTSGQNVPFLIPEYQRPYTWGEDEITTLFDDIWSFSLDRLQDNEASYFLGCVVSNKENGIRQIIDGQQRITSLFLLLRAIFSKLENEEIKSEKVSNFISKIKPALWRENEMTGKEDRKQMLLKSDVVSDSGNEILQHILETGTVEHNASDNYSKNYNRFLELYTEKSQNSPHQIFHFIVALLNYTILLPIDADGQETALTIFNTLNNRGLPLSDADIFKSYIYKHLDASGKKSFIEKWKKLETAACSVEESIQSLFYYHMFYLRAQERDENTTMPGVRKYYLEKKKNRLTANVIDELIENLHLWEVVNGRDAIDSESWSKNLEIRKVLDCLQSYPNEFWKYPVSIFFMKYKQQENFALLFLAFIRKLFVLLLTRYLEKPTISAVKSDILKLNVQIVHSDHPLFKAGFEKKNLSDEYEIQAEKTRIDNLLIIPHKRVERMLLKLLAYSTNEQEELLPYYWEIEHIFPQSWDSKYYKYTKEEVNNKLEHLGNKLPLEKKLNISASNNYFDKKKEKYRKSNIGITSKLGNSSISEWNLDSIIENDKKVCEKIKDILNKWNDEYDKGLDNSENLLKPTEEERKMIEHLKERGLIS